MHHNGLQAAHWGRRPALAADWLLAIAKVAHMEILCGKATVQAAARKFFPLLLLGNSSDVGPGQVGRALIGSRRLSVGGAELMSQLQELERLCVHHVPAADSHYPPFAPLPRITNILQTTRAKHTTTEHSCSINSFILARHPSATVIMLYV